MHSEIFSRILYHGSNPKYDFHVFTNKSGIKTLPEFTLFMYDLFWTTIMDLLYDHQNDDYSEFTVWFVFVQTQPNVFEQTRRTVKHASQNYFMA